MEEKYTDTEAMAVKAPIPNGVTYVDASHKARARAGIALTSEQELEVRHRAANLAVATIKTYGSPEEVVAMAKAIHRFLVDEA